MISITCHGCGQTFDADISTSQLVTTCPHCHRTVELAPSRTFGSGVAIAALVVGLLSLCITPLGLIAVILGIVALVQIADRSKLLHGRGKAIAGIVLGSVGMLLVTPMLIIALLVPAVRVARENLHDVVEASNLKQVSLSMQVYAVENDGMFPQTPEQLLAYVPDNSVFMSPLAEMHGPAVPTTKRAGTLMRFGDVIFVSHKGPLQAVGSHHFVIQAMSAYSIVTFPP